MSVEIDVLNGDASWRVVKPLFDAVWPQPVVATLSWAGITFAHPELRVVVQDEADDALCHVGIYRREVICNGRRMRVGGVGGVMTREDARRRGYATIALNAALQTLKDEGTRDFALLFCEPHNVPFYVARGWRAFDGEIIVEQPNQGSVRFDAMAPYLFDIRRGPIKGKIDLCGLPW